VGAQIQAYLGYLSQGLDAMERAQAYAGMDSGEQLEDVNLRLQGMLERTNSVSHSPLLPQDEPRGKDLQSQLAYSSVVLERLNQRVETLVEQKDILTRQIQQQRDLNNKSDAQRDAQIRELTQHLDQTKRLHQVGEEEAQHSRDQLNLLMEQLDVAKHENVLLEQQRGTSDNMALEAERAARKEMENKFLADMQNKQDEHSNLQAELNNARNETESRSQQLLQELNEAKRAQEQTALELEQSRTETANTLNTLQQQMESLQNSKSAAESELAKVREEMKELETEVVRAQTELTMVRAELDGAYGTRAQRAADVSMNPAVQKELDELNSRNKDLQGQLVFLTNQHETKGVGSAELQNKVNALQKELKDTIEEYEVMTKQSIEDEKERDRLEEIVDTLQQRCETVEMQLNEERLKWLGVKASSPSETTSTMVLKNEFKKMMRETRAENLKTIRVSTSA
jgi:chromosome segregation ATPase